MSGRSSQLKGKTGEREVIVMLQPIVTQVYEAFDLDVPQLQRNSLQSDGGGCDIAGLEWLALEVKRCETLQVLTWWRQAVEQAGKTKTPVLMYRQNSGKWKVMLFGIVGTMTCGRVTPVTITLEDFLQWFRIRLTQELEQ